MKLGTCLIGVFVVVRLLSHADTIVQNEPPLLGRPNKPALKQRVAITSTEIVLLTSEQDIKARTSVDELANYANSMADLIDTVFSSPEQRTGRKLTIGVKLLSSGMHALRIAADPELKPDVSENLLQQLGDLPIPNVSGPIQFDYIVNVWRTPATAASQASSSTTDFPRSVEVIPGKLNVKVFLHDAKNGDELVHCWSFLSDGLAAYKQKEIIITVRRDGVQRPSSFPQEYLELFRAIYQFAQQGRLVDVGDLSIFSEAGFAGHKDFRGLGYIEPEHLPGVDTGDVALLSAIMLKGEEAEIASNYGLTRVTALLGARYHYYPSPPWSDLSREPVATLAEMKSSPLSNVGRLAVHGSYYEQSNHIVLTLPFSSRTRVHRLGELPSSAAVVLLTQPDPRANACLVWRPAKQAPFAITPEKSDASRKTGGFLAFVPQQEATEFRIIEDGLAVFLTDNDWQKLRDALVSGSNASVSASSTPGAASISVLWEEDTYTSPASGETYHLGVRQDPQSGFPAHNKHLAISSSEIVLLTSENDIDARIKAAAATLGNCVSQIADVLDKFFSGTDLRVSRKVTLHLTLDKNSHDIKAVEVPQLPDDVAEALRQRLLSVSAPASGGPVVLDYVVTLWADKHAP
jgi:hypothetical protein